MNTCTRSAFLDNISINILKIVDNIVLLTLNKCRHILIETFMIKLEQNLLATYKFYKEKLHILKRIAKSFKPKIWSPLVYFFSFTFFCGPHNNKIFGITISMISLEKEFVSDNSINQCHFCAYNFFPWFRRLQTFGAFRFTEMYASLIGNDNVTYQRRLSKEKLFQTEDVLK